MTAIQRFAIHGTIMNPHSSGPYVRHEDHLAAMQGRCLAQIEEPANTWPAGLLERVKSALERIENNHCIRRIPADPTDPDLVLAEVRYLLEGKTPPFWVSKLPQRAAPAAVAPRARDLLGIVRTAQAEARRLINGEDSGSDLAQTKLDLPETLRVLEHALSQPAAVAGSALDVTLDEDQAGLLRDMLGDPAEYEEALTVRLIVCDGHSGHGLYVAQAEYQDEGAALLAPLPATAAPALEAPPAVAPQGEYPHEQMDAMALARYKVVPSHASMLWSHAVVAGDGAQQLYVGREVECQNMARKFAGAFLDGAFAFHSMAAAPTAQAAPALEAPAAPVTLMTEDQASRWAWDQIREEVGTKGWTAGDSSNFFGFFLHGWNYRGQYELQRPAAMARAALAAAPQAPAAPVGGNWIAADDVRRLVRELDVALHGEADAAPQASLCDIVGLTKAAASKLGRPVLVAPAEPEMDARDISASRPLVVILENANRGAKWTASSNRSRCLVVGQRSAEEALRRALVDAGAQAAPAAPAVDAAPLDVCTDPYNCARCKAHPNHRKGLEHAGISRPRSAAQAKEGGESA